MNKNKVINKSFKKITLGFEPTQKYWTHFYRIL